MYEFVYRLPVVFAKLPAFQLYEKCNNSFVYILNSPAYNPINLKHPVIQFLVLMLS